MKTLGFGAIFALLGIVLGAETVMVAVGRDGPPGAPGEKETLGLSAVEDGIMEAFFLADTIVFNDGSFPTSEERGALMRRAREGGARRLLLVEVLFSPAAEEGSGKRTGLPERLRYFYYNIQELGEILSGEVLASEMDRRERESPEQFCARLGGEVARQVLAASRFSFILEKVPGVGKASFITGGLPIIEEGAS